MREVNATEAKARLAELLRSVEFGEAVAITRHGKALAHLIPAREHDPSSGIWKCGALCSLPSVGGAFDSYWTLSPYGDHLMTQLRALRRKPEHRPATAADVISK